MTLISRETQTEYIPLVDTVISVNVIKDEDKYEDEDEDEDLEEDCCGCCCLILWYLMFIIFLFWCVKL